MNILITGGAGFIGSEIVRQGVEKGCRVVVVDRLTYAGDLARLADVKEQYEFHRADICDRARIESVFKRCRPEAVIHAAAESHVDRSIQDASPFVESNVKGTQVLLDAARKHGVRRFIHVSTDEVYGEIREGRFSEDSPLRANSPYAASKAAGDLLQLGKHGQGEYFP